MPTINISDEEYKRRVQASRTSHTQSLLTSYPRPLHQVRQRRNHRIPRARKQTAFLRLRIRRHPRTLRTLRRPLPKRLQANTESR
nr:MAG TPA: hypothetical protein [Caudoviricetes sp.]